MLVRAKLFRRFYHRRRNRQYSSVSSVSVDSTKSSYKMRTNEMNVEQYNRNSLVEAIGHYDVITGIHFK